MRISNITIARSGIFCSVFIFLALQKALCQDSTNNSGWEQLKIETKNRLIIGIGEESHGVETFNHVKSDIVRFLLNERTVHSVVFESSFVLCMINYLNEKPLDDRIKGSLYPFWNTPPVQSVLKLFSQQEQAAGKPLITGCDIQEDCRYKVFSDYLLTHKIIITSRQHLTYCDSVLSIFIGKDFSRRRLTEQEYDDLLFHYQFIFSELESKKDELGQRFTFIARCLENRKWLCRYLTLKEATQKMFYRDSLMAANVIWLKDQVYKNESFVVWAANLHVSKLAPNDQPRWMGEWLSKENYYSIAIEKKGLFSRTKKALGSNSFIAFTNEGKRRFDAVVNCNTIKKIKSNEWITPCE